MPAWRSIPTLFPLLRDRKMALVVFTSAILLLGFFAAGAVGWPCPFLHLTGIPCPGCGLTRATSLLLQGELQASLTFHAFAPVVLLGLGLIGSAGVLPDGTRQRWVDKLIVLEQRTGIVLIMLAALIIYWLARLVLLNSAFVQLIRG